MKSTRTKKYEEKVLGIDSNFLCKLFVSVICKSLLQIFKVSESASDMMF